MLQRAYALLTVKAVDPDKRIITGMATTPEPDRLGDIVEPLGVRFKNPLPLLLYHDSTKPVGRVAFDKPTANGITFTATLPEVSEPGSLRDRVNEAWQSVKAGLIAGVSIGFRALESTLMKDGGVRFMTTEVLELSLVAIPANASATIHTIKSLDGAARAAIGVGRTSSATPPGATGFPMSTAMKHLSEQLQAARTALSTKNARLEELDRAETLDVAQQEERDTLTSEVGDLVKQIKRLEVREEAMKQLAQPVPPRQAPAPALPGHTERKDGNLSVTNLPKGTLFTRYAMAVAAGRGSLSDTLAYARRWDGQTPEVTAYIKAVEGTSVPESPGWGSQLVYPTNLVSEFVELLRAATIMGRLDGLRNVPFNVRIPRQVGGSTVNWVGEGGVKPVTELEFDTITMPYHKIAGIVVLTEELVRLSQPSAEETVRRDLVEQISRFIDAQFITANVSAGPNNPASITNGVSAVIASGADADSLYADMNEALATFDNSNLETSSLVILMTPALARGISTLRNALGQFVFPNVSMAGGTMLGFKVQVSGSVPTGNIILVKPDEILVADDGRVTLDASNQATLDMTGQSSPTFSLWQKNCIGIRAERWITWLKRRAEAVALITGASYGPAVGSP